MNRRDNRTGEQRRADLRAEVSDAVGAALIHCDRSARATWAAVLDVSTTHLDNCIAGTKALHVADALAAPQAVRHALAQLLVGGGHTIAALPAADAEPDSHALLASEHRDAATLVSELMQALADGHLSSDEGERVAAAADRLLSVTCTVRDLGLRAKAARGLRLRAVAR